MEQTATEILEKTGLKATRARIALIGLLSQSKSPIDANTLHEVVIKMGLDMDLATLYRNLNLFVAKQILNRVEFQEGKFRYELSALPHHHHAICESCGNIQDVEECNVALQSKFKVKDHSVEFYGLCASCQ